MDSKTFTELVNRHAVTLVRFANSILRSRDAAEDVVQDVLWKVWEGRGSWNPPGSELSYLMTAVRNASLNMLKHSGVEERYRASALIEAEQGGGDTEIDKNDLRNAVQRLLQHLPEPQREAVTLRYEYEMSYKEGARVMGISAKSFEMHLARGMKRLQELITSSSASQP